MKSTFILCSLLIISFSSKLEAKKTHSKRTAAKTPEQELAGFTVPDGYVIELVASEKDGIINPIDMAFDDAGRLWTQTARMYPLDPVKDISWQELLRLMDNPAEQDKNPEFKRIKDLYQGKTKGKDDILVISNIYGNGSPKVKKFATGLTIPQSILPYKNGAYVMQGSELFYLEDTDQDGTADKRIPVLTGFGFTDTHTMGHSLVRGPGGWVHFSQGALNKGKITAVKSGESRRIDFSKIARFSLNGNQIQLVNAGLNNIWGFQLRGNGQWYMTEANDLSWSVVPAEPFTSYKGIGNQKLRTYQPQFPSLHKFRVGGTGISGMAFNDDAVGSFASEYKDVAFLANPITSKINNVKIVRNPDGSVTAEHLPDFLTSKDDWFRPVHVDFGPDGNLYIADWYNKIVSHNEVATTHPDRDKLHGRIWRVRPKSAAERKVPNLYTVATKELVEHLKSDYAWERKAAWQQIADRSASELKPALIALAHDSAASAESRIHALWSLESLGAFEPSLLTKLYHDLDGNIRREALRSLISFQASPEFLAKLLENIATEKNVMVRSQAIRTIEQLGKTSPALIDVLVSFCHPPAKGNSLGGSYETNFERALARRALEKYPAALKSYIKSPAAKKHAAQNLIWAQQSIGSQTAESFARQWKTLETKPFDKETLILVSGLSLDVKIRSIVKPYFSDPARAKNIAQVALKNIAEAYTPAFGYPLAESAMQLMQSADDEDKILGLKLIAAYRITHLTPQCAALLTAAKSSELKSEIVTALSYLPKNFASQFRSIFTDKSNSGSLRIQALTAYNQANGGKEIAEIKKFLNENPGQKSTLIESLGGTTQGCQALLKLVTLKTIANHDLPNKVVDRVFSLFKNDPSAIALNQFHRAAQKKHYNEAATKITQLEKYIRENPGNVATGKAIFTGMCLSCHVVGDEGAGIGPALDGSGSRDLNHLLTAIIRPDDAAENAYILHRTIDAAGQITEGLKIKQDRRGVTLAFQGGATHFSPSRTLAKQHPVGSQSFMPSGVFDKLAPSVMADIVSYMKTLK